MITISLFSGCGGLDYGFEAAGCSIVARNDSDKYSCHTLRKNGAKSVFEAPIEEISSDLFKMEAGTSNGTVDFVIGGPPCQPFSKSAYWSRGGTLRLEDPRANTLTEYFRIVEDLKPRAFLLENVHGINYSGKEEGFSYIINRISEINRKTGTDYRPSWKVLNAADYGVPQLRVRFFLVAFRDGSIFQFPEPTHSNNNLSNKNLFNVNINPYVTSWDAIGHIIPDEEEKLEVGGRWANLLPSIPEGENYLWHTDRKNGLPLFGWRTRYWCFLLKLAKNQPSWTIQAQPGSAVGPFHWKNRRLSWREMAALQTFPEGFVIEGPRVEIQRQIGNAVPSLLAEVLARKMIQHINKQVITDPYKLSVNRALYIPDPEPVMEVPKEYLSLIGKHDPHPGTGKGKSYQNILDIDDQDGYLELEFGI